MRTLSLGVTLLTHSVSACTPSLGVAEPSPLPSTATLQVDPLLLAYAGEVWSVAAKDDNPLWPGWNAASTPLLFYIPDEQDVLVNFPKTVDGFKKFAGPPTVPGFNIQVRSGPTFLKLDGQNTATKIEGVETLVVADTFSNARQRIDGWSRDSRPVDEKLAELSPATLFGDPYDALCMIAHEAFHVFQFAKAPNKGGNEGALRFYPTLSVANNVGFALEGDALAKALRAGDSASRRAAAVRWLAVRQERRAALSKSDVDYEDGTEFNEGLAKYIEYRLLEVLPLRKPPQAIQWAQGFAGYEGLSARREQYVNDMRRQMRGEVLVNNDPYGASPLRMRLYYSGMAIAKLLDHLAPNWHGEILRPKTTLTGLAADALRASKQELDSALAEAKRSPDHAELVAKKTELETQGKAAIKTLLDSVVNGPNTRLVVDYAKLKVPALSMSYTPFGVTRVDEDRTIFTLVPIFAGFGGGTEMEQSVPTPLLQDRKEQTLTMQLTKKVTDADVRALLGGNALPSEPTMFDKLELPGVTLTKTHFTGTLDSSELRFTLEPRK